MMRKVHHSFEETIKDFEQELNEGAMSVSSFHYWLQEFKEQLQRAIGRIKELETELAKAKLN